MESKKRKQELPSKIPPISLNRHRGWGLVGGGGEEQQVITQQICWFCDYWRDIYTQIEKTLQSF